MSNTEPQDQDQPQEAADAAVEDSQQQEAQEDAQANPNREAAKYRTKLRETEAELETAQQRVAHLQRTLAEAALEDHLSKPGDLWEIGGQDVGSFYDDAGDLDRDALTEAAQKLTRERPGLGPQQRIIIPNVGDAPTSRGNESFTDAFRPPGH